MKTGPLLLCFLFFFCVSCHTQPDSPRENGWYYLYREYARKHKKANFPDNYRHGKTDSLKYKRLENALAEELKKNRTSSRTNDYMQSPAYKNYKAYLAAHPECIHLMFQSFLFKGSPQGLYGYLIDDIIQGKYPEAPCIRNFAGITNNRANESSAIREYQKKITQLINTGQAMKTVSSQDKAVLQNQLATLIRGFNAKVGVAIRYDGEETVAVNDSTEYAMLSTFKFPLALAVLDELDKKQLPLETEIYVAKSDLHPNTYSPLRDARPEGNFKISIGELLRYTVALSDNNACDILIHYLGGPAAIQNYIARAGITGITIVATEDEMHQKENPYLNYARPSAVVELLEKFLGKTLLSFPYQDFLEKIMLETSTGTDKLKGLLPSGTPVGHKTGSSDRNTDGLKAADNDAGFVMLPNGKHFTIAVFVMDSREDDKANALLIARVAKAAYDHYTNLYN